MENLNLPAGILVTEALLSTSFVAVLEKPFGLDFFKGPFFSLEKYNFEMIYVKYREISLLPLDFYCVFLKELLQVVTSLPFFFVLVEKTGVLPSVFLSWGYWLVNTASRDQTSS